MAFKNLDQELLNLLEFAGRRKIENTTDFSLAQFSSPDFSGTVNSCTKSWKSNSFKDAGKICGMSIGDMAAAAHLEALYNRPERRIKLAASADHCAQCERSFETTVCSTSEDNRQNDEITQNSFSVEANFDSKREERKQIVDLNRYQVCSTALGETSECLEIIRRKKKRISCCTSHSKSPVAVRLVSPVCRRISTARKRKTEDCGIVVEEEKDIGN